METIAASKFYKIVTKKDIENAFKHIKENSIKLIPGTIFNIQGKDGALFPAKDTLRYAAKLMNLEIRESGFNGGKEGANIPFKRLGYNVVEDDTNQTNVWVEKTLVKGRLDRNSGNLMFGKALWSPTRGKGGSDIYKLMREVKPNDIVIHLIDNKEISGVSLVKEKFNEGNGADNTDWSGPAYIIPLKEYIEITPKLNRSEILNAKYKGTLDDIRSANQVFYNRKLELNQGKYLTKSPEKLTLLLNQIYIDKTGENLPHFNHLLNINIKQKKYWLYSPGENAEKWEEFYNDGIIALGWDNLGSLSQYEDKEEIVQKLQELEKTSSSKKNDATANWEFNNEMSIGDIVIVKKGRRELLGYGKVTSSYGFSKIKRTSFKSYRKVDWIKKGNWEIDFDLVVKTLTDITNYNSESPDYNLYYERLLGIMENRELNYTRNMKHPLNRILYGPPGTGKTYKTKELAVNLILGLKERTRTEIIEEFDRLQEKKQVSFTTFHQSISYEDFIEGIKPIMIEDNENDLKYEIQEGLFKIICKKALSEYYKKDISTKKNPVLQRLSLFDDGWNYLIEETQSALDTSKNYTLKTKTDKKLDIVSISSQGNLIIKPETDNVKEYTISYPRTQKLFEVFDNLEDVKNINKEFRSVIGGSNSTAYWSVLNFINNWVKGNLGASYSSDIQKEVSIKDSLIKFNSEIVKNNKSPEIPNYVLIIDEINRGNISAIFGELITLLEDDKRLGEKEAILVNLPYSKHEKFGVPPNLYIIGTMNTADRSVEALDTALRRRFSFNEIKPKPNILKDENVCLLKGILSHNGSEINLISLLKTINKRLELLIDKDHKIGHSYFINIKDFKDLKTVFKDKVIPLLEEYFFGDFGKIGLVLGSEFIQEVPNNEKVDFAINFKYDDSQMLKEKAIYSFTKEDKWNEKSFISIYSNIKEDSE